MHVANVLFLLTQHTFVWLSLIWLCYERIVLSYDCSSLPLQNLEVSHRCVFLDLFVCMV